MNGFAPGLQDNAGALFLLDRNGSSARCTGLKSRSCTALISHSKLPTVHRCLNNSSSAEKAVDNIVKIHSSVMFIGEPTDKLSSRSFRHVPETYEMVPKGCAHDIVLSSRVSSFLFGTCTLEIRTSSNLSDRSDSESDCLFLSVTRYLTQNFRPPPCFRISTVKTQEPLNHVRMAETERTIAPRG